MEKESEVGKSKGHTRIQWILTLTVNLSLLTYGLQCGWLSPMVKVLQGPESPFGRPLTDTEISLIAGGPSFSAAVGILIFMYVVDKFGRRWSIILTATFQLLAWILTIYPTHYVSLLIGRLFFGMGAGGCFHIIPMYVKEISQADIRGTLGSFITVFQNVGIIIMYTLGMYLDYYTILYVVVFVPALNILLCLKVPESPSFLVKTGRMEDAAKTIAYFRGLEADDKEVKSEIDSLKREDDFFKSIPNVSFVKIFSITAWRRGFLILIAICAVRAINGSVLIITYASTILAAAVPTNGDNPMNISPELQSLGIPVFLTIGSLIGLSVIHKLGRKLLLLVNLIISTVSLFIFATSVLLQVYGIQVPGWIPIVTLLLTVLSYGGGVSSVPYIVMAEMFNFQIRAKLMAILSIWGWFLSSCQLASYTPITKLAGTHSAFYLYCAGNAFGIIITIIFLPETGGKNVEEIELELVKGKNVKKTDADC